LKIECTCDQSRRTRTRKRNSQVASHLVIRTYSCGRTHCSYFNQNTALGSPQCDHLGVINTYLDPSPIPYNRDGRVRFHILYYGHNYMPKGEKSNGPRAPRSHHSKPLSEPMGSAVCWCFMIFLCPQWQFDYSVKEAMSKPRVLQPFTLTI
jgi:hypothetical protein